MSAHLPPDRGVTGLGLIMQFGGTFFAATTGTFGITQVMVMSESRMPGAGGLTAWMFLLMTAGVIRSLYHRAAGVELLYGNDGRAAIRKYLIVSLVHTLLWIAFFSFKLDLTAKAWFPLALLFAAWPVTVVAMLAHPALASFGEPATNPDRGFESMGTLMLVFGIAGALFSLVMLKAFLDLPSGRDGGLLTMLKLVIAMLVARSIVHAHAGGSILADASADRVDAASNRYVNFGLISSCVVGGFMFILMMKAGGAGVLAIPMIAGLTLMLLAWPTVVRRLVTIRRMELFAEPDQRVRPATDRGRTALGWLLLAFGGMAIATTLPAVFLSDSAGAEGAMELTGMAGLMNAPTRGVWLSLGVAVLEVWAGAELVLMTARHRTVASAFGVAAVIVQIYVALPLLDTIDEMNSIAPGNAGQMLFASLAIGLVVPLVTIALVQRPLPSTPEGAAKVFE